MNNILDRIGRPAALENLAEECTELAHAALKLARILRDENPTPDCAPDAQLKLLDEFRDVLASARILEMTCSEKQIVAKLKRAEKRLQITPRRPDEKIECWTFKRKHIIICGPSCSGKSTVEKKLMYNYGYAKNIPFTTRNPRPGETSADYNFVNDDYFRENLLRNPDYLTTEFEVFVGIQPLDPMLKEEIAPTTTVRYAYPLNPLLKNPLTSPSVTIMSYDAVRRLYESGSEADKERIFIVELTASENVIRKRMEGRAGNTLEAMRRMRHDQLSKCEVEGIPRLIIDGENSEYVVDSILKELAVKN